MANAYLSRTPATAGNRKAWTISMWLKLGSFTVRQQFFGTTSNADQAAIVIEPTGTILAFTANASQTILRTTQVLRDPSAWYHIVWAENTTQGTPSDRSKLYINGVQVTSFANAQYPSLDYEGSINNTVVHYVSSYDGVNNLVDGYLAEINFINATNLTPSSFGYTDTNGVWQPKAYTGVYGTTGFYLDFRTTQINSVNNATALGFDKSGNSNNWTVNNISVVADSTYDAMGDGPSANFPTLNPLNRATQVALSSGNLVANFPANNWTVVPATMAFGGKQYCEMTILARNQADVTACGLLIANQDVSGYLGAEGSRAYEWSYQSNNATVVNNGATVASSLPTYGVGDVIGFAFDSSAGRWWIAKNNVWVNSGNPATGTNPTVTGLTNPNGYVPAAFGYTASGTQTQWRFNAGQQAFAYTPPTGFAGMNTASLPTPAIVAPNTQMDVAVWTGVNTANAITISSLQFQPDVVWGKTRSISYTHGLHDSNRGINAGRLRTNDTTAEVAPNAFQFGSVTAFNANGFTTSPGSTDNENWNTAGATYVAWNWRAGGTAVSNTTGTITSQVSANPTAGFSVVTYTGSGTSATIGHGIGSIPQMIIIKARTSATNWRVYAQPLGITGYLNLNTTDSVQTASIWGAPTATGFVIGGTGYEVNESGVNYVAYCFAPIAGYSAMGSYTGNGSTDGPFVYCGFRPRYVLIKASSRVDDWKMLDTARDTFNPAGLKLYPNLSTLENGSSGESATTNLVDFLSNGFKLRTGNSATNNNGDTFIYLAFAESSFKFSRAR